MSFQKNVSAVIRSDAAFRKDEEKALTKKWTRDAREYVSILKRCDAMISDGCPLETVKKELYAAFRERTPELDSAGQNGLKAFRAPFKPIFESGNFGIGFDWEAYVAGFETQDAWRKAHRKSIGARPNDGTKGEPKTDADRVAAMLATLSGCDDIPGAVAAFIEGASQLIEG